MTLAVGGHLSGRDSLDSIRTANLHQSNVLMCKLNHCCLPVTSAVVASCPLFLFAAETLILGINFENFEKTSLLPRRHIDLSHFSNHELLRTEFVPILFS